MRAYWPKRLKKYILHGRTGTTTRKVKIIDDWDQWLVVNVPNNHVRYGDTIHKYEPPPPAQEGIGEYLCMRYGCLQREIFLEKFSMNMVAITAYLMETRDQERRFFINDECSTFFLYRYSFFF